MDIIADSQLLFLYGMEAYLYRAYYYFHPGWLLLLNTNGTTFHQTGTEALHAL